jgi:hypothetical protein
MPKRFMLGLALIALGIVACHGSSTTPSATASPASPSPNPSITKALILVTIKGTPKPNIPVEESTPADPGSPRPGQTIETILTGKKGMATFRHLAPSKTYCWVAVFGKGLESSECAGWAVWQTGTIELGT